jgi:hypothetical protein
MNPSDVLEEHARACDEIHATALELRHRLLAAGTFDRLPLQQRWAAALARLNDSCARLQAVQRSGVILTAEHKAAAGRLAQRVNQVAELALENENLMLGQTLTQLSGKLPAPTFSHPHSDAARSYGGSS